MSQSHTYDNCLHNLGKIVFFRKELLHVSARKFDLHHWKYFTDERLSHLLALDKELEWCQPEFKELDIKFLPT